MIAKGTTHNHGATLAAYMVTGKDGEKAELYQVKGFANDDIISAFRSIDLMALGTNCRKPFFHAQVRCPEGETLTKAMWERVVDKLEEMLDYRNQPRAIAFHRDEDTGHEHLHVAWSRIDMDTMKARPLPFFKLRMKEACRELEKEMGLIEVTNDRGARLTLAPSRMEEEQSRRLGTDIHAIRETIRACYDNSDCGKAFMASLDEHRLRLRKGDKRDFVVLDEHGGIHALGKRILGVSAAAAREKLSDVRPPAVSKAPEMAFGATLGVVSRAATSIAGALENFLVPQQPVYATQAEQDLALARQRILEEDRDIDLER